MPGAPVRACTNSFAHRAKAAPREKVSASPASTRRCMRSSKPGTVLASDGVGTEVVRGMYVGMWRERGKSGEGASLVEGGTSCEPASCLLVVREGDRSREPASCSRRGRCRVAVLCEREHAGDRRGVGKICSLPFTPLGAAGDGGPCISARTCGNIVWQHCVGPNAREHVAQRRELQQMKASMCRRGELIPEQEREWTS